MIMKVKRSAAIAANGFEVVRRFHYDDTRPGAYTIVLCARQAVKFWINKNWFVHALYLIAEYARGEKILPVSMQAAHG